MITAFRLFENNTKLKKYILLSCDGKLSIIDIFNPHMNVVGELTYNTKTLFRINDNGVRELSPKSTFEIRYKFIIKYMVSQSDDLTELVKKMQLIYNSDKYNL